MPESKKKTYPRLFDISAAGNQSIFLFGPRGTGKTSWIRTHLQDAVILDLLKTDLYRRLLANPSDLEKLIPPNHQDWIVIDEVQKVPELLNEVHRLIESKGYRFMLTGSSARSLRRKGVNLLAGRALDFRMHPLTCSELGEDFILEKAVKYGLLPTVYQVDDPELYLQSYIGTYLREEVFNEGLSRNIAEFAKFLEVASFSQGELVNYSEIARETGLERRTVKSFFDIAEDLLISVRLPVFAKRAQRKMVTHAKFYYFDAGVYRALRPKGPLDVPEETDGPVLETLFLAHLRAINDYYRLGYQLFFWRTADQTEVDFVAYGERGLIAFEIKRKKRIGRQELKGLKAFGEDYPIARLYLLHGGDEREYHDRVEVIPFEQCLRNLKTILDGSIKAI